MANIPFQRGMKVLYKNESTIYKIVTYFKNYNSYNIIFIDENGNEFKKYAFANELKFYTKKQRRPKMIKEYVRNKNRQKIGTLIAKPFGDNYFSIGWSKAHSQLDDFDTELGDKIAIGRAEIGRSLKDVPHSFKNKVNNFIDRSQRYFKDRNILQH